MKRRSAIIKLGAIGVGAALVGSMYKGWQLFKTPDVSTLAASKNLIADLAETIIPKTDTPGAKDAQVEEFIIRMVKECTIKQSQNNFIDGLKNVESFCDSQFGKSFTTCSKEEQIKTLEHFEAEGKPYGGIVGKVEKRVMGESFFTLLKRYTVLGFCTSEPGATMAFKYDYIPINFIGETDLEPGQKAWATQ
jgi:hypothetical protein